jgi:DoxX
MVSRSSHPVLSCVDNFATSSTDVLQLVGRILMSYLFLSAGWGKLTNVIGTAAYFAGLGVPSPSVMALPRRLARSSRWRRVDPRVCDALRCDRGIYFRACRHSVRASILDLPRGRPKGTIYPVHEKSRDHERIAVRACRGRWALMRLAIFASSP